MEEAPLTLLGRGMRAMSLGMEGDNFVDVVVIQAQTDNWKWKQFSGVLSYLKFTLLWLL